MAYTVNDIAELIRYHLVASSGNDDRADCKLVQLMRDIEQMVTTSPIHETIYWMACEECGAWVSSELIGPDGAGETDSGGFHCTSCRFDEDG